MFAAESVPAEKVAATVPSLVKAAVVPVPAEEVLKWVPENVFVLLLATPLPAVVPLRS